MARLHHQEACSAALFSLLGFTGVHFGRTWSGGADVAVSKVGGYCAHPAFPRRTGEQAEVEIKQ